MDDRNIAQRLWKLLTKLEMMPLACSEPFIYRQEEILRCARNTFQDVPAYGYRVFDNSFRIKL